MLADRVPLSGSVELASVTKTFASGARGIEEVSVRVAPGEFVTFLGPSGSGKTTTLGVIAGFLRPTAGRVLLNERDSTQLAPNKRNLGMVFQHYALFPHLTVAQNVAFGLRGRGLHRAQIADRIEAALQMVRLSGYGDRRPKQLSGGQQQRVALARALVYRPPILLMDEPLGALDKQLRDQMQTEIARLHRELGTTFLFVTHDQGEALALSTRIVLFREGRVVQVGTPQELYTRPNCRFAAEFLGESTSFTGRLVSVDAIAWGGTVLRGVNNCQAARGDEATLVVRPEHVRIVQRQDSMGPGANRLSGLVGSVTYQGSHRRVTVQLHDGSRVLLEDRGTGEPSVAPGEQVVVQWPVEHGVLVTGEPG